MHILARQPVWRRDQDQLESRHGGLFSQPVQSGAIQGRACVAIISIDMLICQSGRSSTAACKQVNCCSIVCFCCWFPVETRAEKAIFI